MAILDKKRGGVHKAYPLSVSVFFTLLSDFKAPA
jgi:hypothetical protein